MLAGHQDHSKGAGPLKLHCQAGAGRAVSGRSADQREQMAGERRAYLESLPALLTKTGPPPPGGESANLVNWGLVHGEPTRSAHSKIFLRQRKNLWVAKLKTLTKHPLANEVKLSKKIQNGTLFNFISIKDIPRRIVTNVSGMRINGPRQNISDRIFGIKSILHWMVFAAMICHSRN